MAFPIESIEVVADSLVGLRVEHDEGGNTLVHSWGDDRHDGIYAFEIVTRRDSTDGNGNMVVDLELSDLLLPLKNHGSETDRYSRLDANIVGTLIYSDSKHFFADTFGTPLFAIDVVDGIVEARAITWTSHELKKYHQAFFDGEEVSEGVVLPLVSNVPREDFEYAKEPGHAINRLLGDELFSQLDWDNPDVDFLCRRLVGAIYGYSQLTGQSYEGITRTILAIQPKEDDDRQVVSTSMHLKSNAPDALYRTSHPHVHRLGKVLLDGAAQFKPSIEKAMGIEPVAPALASGLGGR